MSLPLLWQRKQQQAGRSEAARPPSLAITLCLCPLVLARLLGFPHLPPSAACFSPAPPHCYCLPYGMLLGLALAWRVRWQWQLQPWAWVRAGAGEASLKLHVGPLLTTAVAFTAAWLGRGDSWWQGEHGGDCMEGVFLPHPPHSASSPTTTKLCSLLHAPPAGAGS